MDGVIKELAEEYHGAAHVVKVDIGAVAGSRREVPDPVDPDVHGAGPQPEEAFQEGPAARCCRSKEAPMTARFRTSGMTRKDMLSKALESNGANPQRG